MRIERSFPIGFIKPCLPTRSQKTRSGPQWVHEIKHDGYRLLARRNDDRVHLFTRRGYEWTKKYPRIVESLRSLKVRSVTIDGEAVWCGVDGKSNFDKLHSRTYNYQVFLYGFDLLELNGEDYRELPLEKRRAKLAKLLSSAGAPGIQFSEHLEGNAETIFEHVCKMGLEGIVSKRRDFPYRSGRVRSWIKIINPASPAMLRIIDGRW